MAYKLRPMHRTRRILFRALFIPFLVVACQGEPVKTRAPVTVARPTVPVAAPPLVPAVGWDSAVGSAIVIANRGASGGELDSVSILRPDFVEGRYNDTSTFDLRPLSRTRLDLFGRSGAMGSATLRSGVVKQPGAGCSAWPAGRVVRASSQTVQAAPGWRVALDAGKAVSIPLDSLVGMSVQDSTRLATEVTRAATRAMGRSDSVFAGVPFVPLGIYRMQLHGTDVIAASLQRSIPSEANPRQEQLFVILERSTTGDTTYHTALVHHAVGGEYPAEVSDILAAVTLRENNRPALIVSDEYDDGGSIGIVQRVGPGRWRETWKSAYTGC